MAKYIEREAFIGAKRKQYCADCDRRKGMKSGKMRFCYEIGEAPCRACSVDDMLNDVEDFPAADVVPWEWLERYADYFCAGVSMPEFVREAKMFYESTNKAMQGGVIDG